jgi:hypothetical protein
MNTPYLTTAIARSEKIRDLYHALERKNDGAEWTVEVDALAFLTDAGLVGRLAMAQQGRWHKKDALPELEHKLGECMWWLMVLAGRMDIDMQQALEKFLAKTEALLREQ